MLHRNRTGLRARCVRLSGIALRRVDVGTISKATIVCKRGPMGCVVFPADIPPRWTTASKGPGFPVEVYNVLGAGDAFLSGFLRGWLKDEKLETCCAYANASGAFAVSRLLCSPEIPTFAELQHFLKEGSRHEGPALRRGHQPHSLGDDAAGRSPTLMALAIDHRMQLEAMATEVGAPRRAHSPTSRCSPSRPPRRWPTAGPASAC